MMKELLSPTPNFMQKNFFCLSVPTTILDPPDHVSTAATTAAAMAK